ncbi:MAG: hypothetical protein MUE70_01705 [Desulfobacterales bacterium]|jgi:hypothetical protein|nr:hypothetical protein [Desulfobacterales bacterium]
MEIYKTTQIKIEAIRDVIKNTEPLDKNIKVVLFLCGILLLPYLIAIFYILNRRKIWGTKKIEQAWKYLHMGLGLTLLLFLLSTLL